jgi:O-antigen/teichoic acid export membrane protein
MSSTEAGAAIRRAAGFGIVTSAVTIVTAVARSKVSAVVLGPEGVGQVAAVQQIAQLALVPLSLATGASLVSAFARERASPAGSQRIYDTTATVLAGGGAVLGALALGLAAATLGPSDPHLVPVAGVAVAGAVLHQGAALPSSALRARGDLRSAAVVGIGWAVVSTIATIALIPAFGVAGSFVGSLTASLLLTVAFAGFWGRRLPDLRLWPRPRVDPDHLRTTLSVGSASLVAAAATQVTLSVIRWTLLDHGGHAANGQFQAAWALGATYFGTVLSGVGAGLFPRYAAAAAEDLDREVRAGLDFVWRTAPPVILVALAARSEAMRLLYSGDFDLAARIVGWQMVGDLAKASSWLFAGVLLYRGHARAYALVELVGGGLLSAGAMAFVPRFGPIGTGYGYVAAYLVYLGWTAWVTSRACGVSVPWRHLGATVAFTLLAGALLILTDHVPLANLPIGLGGGVLLARTPLAASGWARLRRALGR